MEQTISLYPEDQKEMYALLKAQMKAVLDGEHHVIPNLANASALLNGALKNINWVGFYLKNQDELLLGPFQGKLACVHIAFGKGVCGTAYSRGETVLVKDVHQFPGHIACDCDSRSEIVVPLFHRGQVVGVLDIDSPLLARFDETDARELEEIARILGNSCDWAELPGLQ
ncbi:GAF domain-containing protein [Caproiciproducens faecalis]|uniref:GAF domain-containing protein n=1 Tax=Caproiciproducens faecalis TaxID=2820301 RepID=A0ABS7DRA8_9FIRM|nr:GAF domain-containing protein [Caproiciproducens faecalis]MBW7573557.1 GAF domain-containing protein [Caproiciproducens faecalis]